jgi:hypothetical protein
MDSSCVLFIDTVNSNYFEGILNYFIDQKIILNDLIPQAIE